ncbi:MAG TPA: hypothetical protein VHW69_17050 [Rhizomicrobium sp.]|jgi:hypothetical protein|nr:hypothetical protein [Rhizomicrobium sp.]
MDDADKELARFAYAQPCSAQNESWIKTYVKCVEIIRNPMRRMKQVAVDQAKLREQRQTNPTKPATKPEMHTSAK